jgi:hypothetical protein
MSPFPGSASSSRRRAALVLAFAACAATALAPASVAVGPGEATAADTSRPQAAKSLHATGKVIPIDDLGTYRLTGDLRGTWYTLTADTYYQSKALIIQKGFEYFDGCLDLNHNDRCDKNRKGQFSADYIYWATFNPDTGRLIKGECIHPITAGKGVFAGLRGLVNMHDKPVGKNGVVTAYEAELVLNATPEKQDAVSSRPTPLPAGASIATC